MRIAIPVLFELRSGRAHARPLFMPDVRAQEESVRRVTARLARLLTRHLDDLASQGRHDLIAACTFHPEISGHRVPVSVRCASKTLEARLLVITFEALGRRLAHVPLMPAVWFEVEAEEPLERRVQEVLTRHVRERARENEDVTLPDHPAWLATIEVECVVPAGPPCIPSPASASPGEAGTGLPTEGQRTGAGRPTPAAPAEPWSACMDEIRRLEEEQQIRFTPEGVGTLVELQRRHPRHPAMPGGVRALADHLAARIGRGTVTRDTVVREFEALTGLRAAFLDPRVPMPREEIIAALRRYVVGQEAALSTVADVVGIARACIRDGSGLLASFLFAGPRGVGRTQCARALAAFLHGDQSRLVSLDMNDFQGPGSAERLREVLAGLDSTPSEGPASVFLLDDVDAADPEVLDLLVHLLGEGAIADAHGRMADLGRTVLVFTTRHLPDDASPDLRREPPGDIRGRIRATGSLLPPDLVDRLDAAVGFTPLGREEVGRIVRRRLAGLTRWEGLSNRPCVLQVDTRVFESLVEEGCHPVQGARPLRDIIERRIAGPLAAGIAALPPRGAVLIAFFAEREAVTASVHRFTQAAPHEGAFHDATTPLAPFLGDLESRLAALEAALPPTSPAGDAPEAPPARDLDVAQGLLHARAQLARLHEGAPGLPPPYPYPDRTRRPLAHAPLAAISGMLESPDLREAMGRAVGAAWTPAAPAWAAALALQRDVLLLSAIAAAEADEEVLIWIRGLDDGDARLLDLLASTLCQAGSETLDLDADFIEPPTALPQRALRVRGKAAWRLFRGEHGTHVFLHGDRLQPLSVVVHRVPWDTSQGALDALRAGRAQWIEAMRRGQATFSEAPHPLGDVVRLYDPERSLDLRSGLLLEGPPDAAAMRELLLGGLS